MFLSLVFFVVEPFDTWSAGAKQHRPSTQQKKPSNSPVGDVALGLVLVWIQIRVSVKVFSSSFQFGNAVLDLFSPPFKLALRPGSTPDSSRHRLSISLPRNHVAFSFAKQVRFEHSIRRPSPIITSKREEKHPDKRQTDDQTKSFSAVRRRSVLVHPDRDRGQRCSTATSLATASAGTVLLPRQMSQIDGHVILMALPSEDYALNWNDYPALSILSSLAT